MNKLFILRATLAACATMTLPLAQAATMSKAEHDSIRTRITATASADKAACAQKAGNSKDICIEQAKGKEAVARAELEFSRTALPADRNRLLVARADSAYSVAKERCDDAAGNVKDVCVEEAKAVHTKSLANAKMGREMDESAKEADEASRDADYGVASEKCDAMAGDAKTACMTEAKAKFGKN
jgi:hypothetical protein